MFPIAELLNPLLWGLAAVAAFTALLAVPSARRDLRLASSTLLALTAFGLLAALCVAAWLPPRALAVLPDGSPDDPRMLSVLALGAASLVALLAALRALRLSPIGTVGAFLPGIGIGGLVAATSSFVGLRTPVALAAVVLGGVVLGLGLALFARHRWCGMGAISLQAGATGLLVVAGVLSLHGARAPMLELHEGAPVDTLGHRIVLSGVAAPNDSLRVLDFTLAGRGASEKVRTSLEGRAGAESRSIAGGSLLGGPIVVPVGLRELRPRPHDLVWLARGDTTSVAGSVVRFVGFRILPGDTVRMLADLDVTSGDRTQRVSPGMYATPEGTTPFAAAAEGLGPIALGRMDADNGRVAIMLPAPSSAAVTRIATASLHLRPALPFAWLGAALAALFLLAGFAAPESGRRG